MSPSPQALRHLLEQYPASHYWIAYSGGLDSRVLLHLCSQLKAQFRISFTAIHVHHGLQAIADEWVEHCRHTAAQSAIPCEVLWVDARPEAGASPEEAARNARYQAFRSVLREGDILLTAQHQNDQAETLLLQLFRGAGLAGLSAMPEYAPLPPGFILRPLLAYSRNALETYARTHDLTWVEDPSNQDQGYDRNFLRQDIWPRLEQRWPALASTLTRTARHCAEAQKTLDDQVQNWLTPNLLPEPGVLELSILQTHSPAEQALILRAWLKHNGLRMVSTRLLQQIQDDMMTARPDRNPKLKWQEAEIRRYRDALYLYSPPLPTVTRQTIRWDGNHTLRLPDDNGRLEITQTLGTGIRLDVWQNSAISVKYREGGENIHLPGRQMRHELKKFLQEQGIPPWIRERLPLIYLDRQLASIAGRWVMRPFVAGTEDRGVEIRWIRQTIS